jgi:hypothetical protein
MDKKQQFLDLLDQIILKYEWEDSKNQNGYNGVSWDVHHLNLFKKLLIEYLDNEKK